MHFVDIHIVYLTVVQVIIDSIGLFTAKPLYFEAAQHLVSNKFTSILPKCPHSGLYVVSGGLQIFNSSVLPFSNSSAIKLTSTLPISIIFGVYSKSAVPNLGKFHVRAVCSSSQFGKRKTQYLRIFIDILETLQVPSPNKVRIFQSFVGAI